MLNSSQSCPSTQSADAAENCKLSTIYVVQGSTGEYSDRTEWLVRAYHTEAEARAEVEFLTAARRALNPHDPDDTWAHMDRIEAAMQAFDPRYQEDYTGSRWFVSSVELSAQRLLPPEPSSSSEAVAAGQLRDDQNNTPTGAP
jgi:hypothetical protein